jgi:hypothetical protein
MMFEVWRSGYTLRSWTFQPLNIHLGLYILVSISKRSSKMVYNSIDEMKEDIGEGR